jgi:hypothetical protein
VNHYPATVPRTWVFGGLLSLMLGVGFAGPKSLWDADFAALGGRWEVMAFAIAVAILFWTAAMARFVEEFRPALAERILSLADRFSERRWLVIAFCAWAGGWMLYHELTDPSWVASGIDWHDSHLDAYSLLHGDPPLYCAWRYPFYPYMAATLSYWSGLELEVMLQFVSRAVSIATAIPLYIIGRRLFGRGAAISGILLLTSLATFRMHTDAVTPYPMVMFLAASGAAGLVLAARGGLWPWLFVGLCSAALLVNDGKSLLVALGLTGLGVVGAVFIPWRWKSEESPPPPTVLRGRGGGLVLRSVRILLLGMPLVFSYQWMSSLPVKGFTLEEMAVAYLVPGGRGAQQTPRNLQTGYMWGHFDDAWTVPRTLQTFWKAGRDPALAVQNKRQLRTSIQRLRLDYPGFTWRVPAILTLAFLVPLARRRNRWQTLFQVAAAAVVVVSCWPSIKSDYQERYVVHGAVLLPILMMGAMDLLARSIVGSRTRIRSMARGGGLIVIASFLLLWPVNPAGFSQLSDRLDPVAMGGLQEHEVNAWGRENLQTGDLLLDSSWMMQGLLLGGSHTIARSTDAYPPGGAPWPSGSWRFTRPWPEERPSSGRYFALVNYLAMAPNTFDATHVPIEDLITGPDSDLGKQIAAAPDLWTEVFRTSDTIVRVYRWNATGAPPDWQTRRRPM